jgi:hypothetical protein
MSQLEIDCKGTVIISDTEPMSALGDVAVIKTKLGNIIVDKKRVKAQLRVILDAITIALAVLKNVSKCTRFGRIFYAVGRSENSSEVETETTDGDALSPGRQLTHKSVTWFYVKIK